MLQQPQAHEYVLATGMTTSVRSFCGLAAAAIDCDLTWDGERVNTVGIARRTGKTFIRVKPKFYHLAEVDLLIGDPTKAREKLGWSAKTTLPEFVEMMVKADVRRARAREMLL